MSRAAPRFHRSNLNLPAIPNSNVIEMVVQGTLEGQMTINTFYYLSPIATLTSTLLQNVINAFNANVISKILPCCSADWSLTNYKGINAAGTGIAPINVIVAGGNAGSGPAGHEPTMVAGLLSRVTTTQGQHGRGRLYLPAVPTSWVTSSTLTAAAALTAYGNLANAMLMVLTDGTNNWTPCLVQRSKLSPRPIVGAQALFQVSVKTLLATVRRRRIGRGK